MDPFFAGLMSSIRIKAHCQRIGGLAVPAGVDGFSKVVRNASAPLNHEVAYSAQDSDSPPGL